MFFLLFVGPPVSPPLLGKTTLGRKTRQKMCSGPWRRDYPPRCAGVKHQGGLGARELASSGADASFGRQEPSSGRPAPLAFPRLKAETVEEETDDAPEQVQRRADHRRAARAGGRGEDRGGLSPARDQRYGGLEVSEARRLKALEDENRQLKKLLGRGGARRRCTAGPAGKKLSWPAARRQAALRLMAEHGLSQRRAWRLLEVDLETVRRRRSSATTARS